MTSNDEVEPLSYVPTANLRKVKIPVLTHTCPEAGGRTRTKHPRARLERWSILRDLLVDVWSNPGTPSEDVVARHLGALSPLEADLIRRMYLNVSRIFPIPDGAEVDLEGQSITFDHGEQGITTSVYLTVSVTHEDGSTEHVRLKTGRAPSTTEEAAVLWRSAEEGDGFFDLMAWSGELESIEPPSDLEVVLEDMVVKSPVLTRSGVRPGPACVWCERTATCGAFPAPRVAPSNARTVNLTKTDIEALERCQRRVAWRRVHGVPRDDGEEVDLGAAISQGRLFHRLVQMAELSDDQPAAVTDYLRAVPPSEASDLAVMWDKHRELMEIEGLTARAAEFPVGLTLLEGERAEMRGVTLIAFIDLTARTAIDQPVAVEIKSGSPAETGVEDDLYAVGMRRWIGAGQPVVIHRHYVGWSPPQCEVVEMAPDEIDAAAQRLAERVQPIYGWDWEDPLQPEYRVGGWCNGCEFKATCEAYR